MNRFSHFTLFVCLICSLYSCAGGGSDVCDDMVGAWVLKKIIFPTGYEADYPNARGYTRCKIYDNDSTFYYAELLSVDDETIILPLEFERYTFIYDEEDTLLGENGRFMWHFRFVCDTVYTVFNNMEQEVWVKSGKMTEGRKNEIMSAVRDNIGSGEELIGLRKKPKILADALEALIGAIYIDCSPLHTDDYKSFILNIFKDKLKCAESLGATDYKTLLLQFVEKNGDSVLRYEYEEQGPEHNKTFKAVAFINNNRVGEGTGRTKRSAETAAAKEALKLFGIS